MKSLLIEMTELADRMESVASPMIMSDSQDELLCGWEIQAMAEMLRNMSREISNQILRGAIKVSRF